MTLLEECKMLLDITDNDRDAKLTLLLEAGYSSMTNTADVAPFNFSVSEDNPQIDALLKIALVAYVAMQLETDPEVIEKWRKIYENQVGALEISQAFGDYPAEG